MNEIGKRITDKLIEIYGSANFSIAFLPYKRSMWNSMQSVYEECKAAGADVHCMPIPYIRMKVHKEPDYLDSDFALFGDIAEPIELLKNPDFIAIHYQYEDHNYVTNMLPQYFTKALKEKYGAKIIFLPYGIGSGLGHFAIQPGCRDLDYAFLEDENMADRFIAGWKTQGVDFSGRVFGFGSPKFDIARDLKEKIVPPEWAETLLDRNVTLVCTSLGPFLADPTRRLVRYKRYILEELNKPGHAVIFRPHPLMRTTIKSLAPDMEPRWDKLIFELKNEYRYRVKVDESEYLERAMAASDYLISDPSSVVEMWKETGKGYMIL